MLRSTKDLEHYAIGATDGSSSFMRTRSSIASAAMTRICAVVARSRAITCTRATASWAIRYLIVDASDWLIAPSWIDDISWIDATVSVQLTRQAVKDAPEYDGKTLPDRAQECGLHEHHRRLGYWGED